MRGKDRAALRAEAHHLSTKVHIGHGGVTEAALNSLDDVLRTHELVKCQVSKAGDLSAREAAAIVAGRLDAEIIQVIGRTFTVYRENPELRRGDVPPWR